MFKHFKNLWGGTSDSPPAPAPTRLEAEPREPSTSSSSGETDDEEADELDLLYRQVLAGLDAVEIGCDSVQADLPEDNDDQPQPDRDDNSNAIDREPDRPTTTGIQPTEPTVAPHQVLEAVLFVGGIDLTLKRLCAVLKDEFPPETVEQFVNELSRRYDEEGRPYQVHFGEGGFRLRLRADYEGVCNRVFGLGPREFKLSQDALEVLSLIAYQQPITGNRITSLRGPNASGVLRQLLRRELIALERSDAKEVRYRTTPRFLQAFGIHRIDELPHIEDVEFK